MSYLECRALYLTRHQGWQGTAGSLLVWAEGFSRFCQLPSPWLISLWAEPRAGCLGVCSRTQPPGSPAAAVTQVLHCGRAGLLLPLLPLEGPAHPWQMGGSSSRVSRRFHPVGPRAACHLTARWQCAWGNCFAPGLPLICTKGNGASLFTFHLPMSSCNCSLIPVELQPLGRDLSSARQECSCCSMMS